MPIKAPVPKLTPLWASSQKPVKVEKLMRRRALRPRCFDSNKGKVFLYPHDLLNDLFIVPLVLMAKQVEGWLQFDLRLRRPVSRCQRCLCPWAIKSQVQAVEEHCTRAEPKKPMRTVRLTMMVEMRKLQPSPN